MSKQENLYSSQHTATIFGVARETIRNWADEFAEYLSPIANPGRGKRRMYSYEDLTVISLVAELKKQGMTYADIHVSLKNGQRGQPPALPPEDVQALVVGKQERQLELGVEYLQQSVIQLQRQLEQAQEEVVALREVKTDNIRLTILLEEREKQVEELKAQLAAAQEENKQLLRDSGREFARGIMEALERRSNFGKSTDQ
jgi:DNA-binding transcriptional MerR regulator